jgi:Na+/phosphate symporter
MDFLNFDVNTIKALLDNGFGILMSIILTVILFFIIRKTTKYIEDRERLHQENIQHLFNRFIVLSEKNAEAINRITDSFELFVQNQIGKNDIIIKEVEKANQKIDEIHKKIVKK